MVGMTLFEPHDSNFPSHFGGSAAVHPVRKGSTKNWSQSSKRPFSTTTRRRQYHGPVNGWRVFGGFFSGEIYLDISDIDQFLEISFDITFFSRVFNWTKKNRDPQGSRAHEARRTRTFSHEEFTNEVDVMLVTLWKIWPIYRD